MNKDKDIENYDYNHMRHGYWEKYNPDGTLFYIANYFHGVYMGYVEINWGKNTSSITVNPKKTFYII